MAFGYGIDTLGGKEPSNAGLAKNPHMGLWIKY